MNNIKYEITNMKKMRISTFIATIISNVLFSMMIGTGQGFNTLTSVTGIMSILIMAVLGSVKACKYIISNYMGDNKIRLYMFPKGRGPLFIKKIIAFIYLFDSMYILGNLLTYIGLWIMNSSATFLIGNNIFNMILHVIIITLLTNSILIISTTLGVRFSSKVVSIVTCIIIMSIIVNIFANALYNRIILSLVLATFLFIISLIFLLFGRRYINHNEISR